MAYIYQIKNDLNDKSYIGKTNFSIEKRFKEHCNDAFKLNKENRPLYAAMRKYGIEHFHISVLEETQEPEIRERYWIEKLQTFKYGYNATIGGDGTSYIDRQLVINTYKRLKNQREVAKQLGIHETSVHDILIEQQVDIISSDMINQEKFGKPVEMYSLKYEYLRTFPSLRDAAQYLINSNQTNCKLTTIRTHISEVCHGKRKTAAKYIWKFV